MWRGRSRRPDWAPAWTGVNRWTRTLTSGEYARIPSPTFHTVPRATSPCLPVMTAQDHVEAALIARVREDPNIDLRFHSEARDLEQTDSETRLRVVHAVSGDVEEVTASYTIGADGPSSSTRAVIGSTLESDPMPINSQDVIFDADLSQYVGDRRGALLYATPRPGGTVIFQPLDGVRRWRCQVSVSSPELLSEEETICRIREALGTTDPLDVTIQSLSLWQPTPGCTTHFSKGRIFLAGDAAHISVPTGGLGNNTGFAGIRNLAWKLAFVLRGISSPSLLETYQQEHRPLAQERIELGVRITQAMIPMMIRHARGEDIRDNVLATRWYGNYDGTLLGFELKSELVAPEEEPPPSAEDAVTDFLPAVRSGRRAPHIWVDLQETTSLFDQLGDGYTLVLGAGVDATRWVGPAEELSAQGFPIATLQLTDGAADSIYERDAVVLVRPDRVIADHWRDGEVARHGCGTRLERLLPRV